MTDKEALDRLSGINMSIDQKKALIDVIKDIAGNNDNTNTDEYIIFTLNADGKSINVYDKDYHFYSTGDNFSILNTELKNKIEADIFANKKFIIKSNDTETNSYTNSIIISHFIIGGAIVLEFILDSLYRQINIGNDI